MKIPKEDEGKTVTIELGRAMYIMDYAAHVKYADGHKALIGEPVMRGTAGEAQPIAMNLLIGVRMLEVAEDSVLVSMVTPGSNYSRIRVPSSLVVAVTEITAHQPPDLPEVTKLKQAPASKIIL
jgi:hypothetical protein